MWVYGTKLLIVYTQRAEFGSHGDCGSEYIIILVCRRISQDHVTNRYRNIMGKSPSRLATIYPSLVVIETVVVKMFSVCHQILQDHMNKG